MMKKKITFLILIGIIFFLVSSCSIKWTKAIQYGKVVFNEASETTVDIEIRKDLIFVPVTIHGKKYQFLFDTGAPLSISKQLQNDYAFKIISKGNIIDSDHNRSTVNWARVDSLNIGDVLFMNQTAFIGDFDANPILSCLEVDGIIGSNLIKQCNWTLDQENKSLLLYSNIDMDAFNESITIPFKTDYQYNIFIDLNFGKATVRKILLDFGSNGSISLNNDIFTQLEDKGIISKPFLEKGVIQSGIIGDTVNLSRKITFTDSVSIDSISLKKVMLRTGKTSLVGNDFLSRFKVTIDWVNKNLYLIENGKIPDSNCHPGFRLGYLSNEGVYVQSVIEQSNAYKKGVRPNMKVLEIDSLDFENGNNFCDYVNHELRDKIFLQLIDSHGQKFEYHIKKTIY